MSDDEAEHRSLSSFWRKGKQKAASLGSADAHSAQELDRERAHREDGDNHGHEQDQTNQHQQDGTEAKTPLTPKEKAAHRRAQVRKAQIQHRQRKANHIRQLELDVGQYREWLAETERDNRMLKTENEAIRQRLTRAGIVPVSSSLPPDDAAAATTLSISVPSPPPQQHVNVNQSHTMEGVQYDHSPTDLDMSSLSPELAVPPPSEPTELFAGINVGDFTVTWSVDETMGTPTLSVGTGTTRSTCTAPSSRSVASPPGSQIGDVILTTQQEEAAINFILALEHVCWAHFSFGDAPQHANVSAFARNHTLMASSYCLSTATEDVFSHRWHWANPLARDKSTYSLAWPAPHISLADLRGLADSLNPGDKELTPVQAWFELMERYPAELLLEPRSLEALKREFTGLVRCPFFGAVIVREAFESVVLRVLGAPTLVTHLQIPT